MQIYSSLIYSSFQYVASRWIGLFVFSNIFPYGTFEITSLQTNKVLKVNGHRLKPFNEG